MVVDESGAAALARAAEIVRSARRIAALTGAGVSTESGIPDFRGPQGTWRRYDPDDFTFQRFVALPEVRRRYWEWVREVGPLFERAEPNAAHRALAELHRQGRLLGIVTQNVDGLHQRGGVPADRVVEIHGNGAIWRCLDCDARYARAELLRRVAAGDDVPACDRCGGVLKSGSVMFGEAIPLDALRRARELAETCDCLIAVGSSLVVQPAAALPLHARRAGAGLIIVNREPTPLDGLADAVLRGSAGELLPALVGGTSTNQPLNATTD